MVLAAQLPDLHFYERRDFDDRCSALDQIITIGIAKAVTVWLVPGDLYHTRSSPKERLALLERIARMAEHAPVVIVRGNHDAPGDVLMFNWLRTTHAIYAHEALGVVDLTDCCIITIPHVDKGQDIAGLPETSLRDRALFMLDQARDYVRLYDEEDTRPIILVSHLGVHGATVSKGETLPDHAADVTLEELVATGADYTALGHIHAAQKFVSSKAGYSGSGTPSDWGEEGQTKGFWIVSIAARGDTPLMTFQPIVSRRWITITCHYDDGNWSLDGPDPETLTSEDIVRIRIEAPADKVSEIDDVRAQAQEAFGHCRRLDWDVKRDRSAQKADQRMAEAETLADMLKTYWEVGDTPPLEFMERCLAALKEIEAGLPPK